jgi:hypothetical protein
MLFNVNSSEEPRCFIAFWMGAWLWKNISLFVNQCDTSNSIRSLEEQRPFFHISKGCEQKNLISLLVQNPSLHLISSKEIINICLRSCLATTCDIFHAEGAIFLWEMAKRAVSARAMADPGQVISGARSNRTTEERELLSLRQRNDRDRRRGKRRAPAVVGNYFSQRRRRALFSLNLSLLRREGEFFCL